MAFCEIVRQISIIEMANLKIMECTVFAGVLGCWIDGFKKVEIQYNYHYVTLKSL